MRTLRYKKKEEWEREVYFRAIIKNNGNEVVSSDIVIVEGVVVLVGKKEELKTVDLDRLTCMGKYVGIV